MKFSVVALIPAISFAATVTKRENGQLLPTVQGDVSRFTKDGGDTQQPMKIADRSVEAAEDSNWWGCHHDYPYWCDGFCCHYDRYCGRECCGHWARFCGIDGYCYY